MQTKKCIACNFIDPQNPLIAYSYYKKKNSIQRSNMMLYFGWDQIQKTKKL